MSDKNTECTLGVGDGSGDGTSKMFVHGSHEAIAEVRKWIDRILELSSEVATLRRDKQEARDKVEELEAECSAAETANDKLLAAIYAVGMACETVADNSDCRPLADAILAKPEFEAVWSLPGDTAQDVLFELEKLCKPIAGHGPQYRATLQKLHALIST